MVKKKQKKKKSKKQSKKTQKAGITAKMTFHEVLKKWPETGYTFFRHGLACVGCPLAMAETIEQGATAHGIDVKKLIVELNALLEKNKKLKKKLKK